ncbi:MAG: histidine--tRNA ligase [Calditrichaeota bacterium]|nr:MAG: histidine--tRNA ligase [Calditrichota bacterium]
MSKIQPRIFRGTKDLLPNEMIKREEIIDNIKLVFRKYGFSPIETPAIEYLSVLAGKYGEEADKLLYKLNYKVGSNDEAALRYDLTVPLSRVIAMNKNMVRPFKRYQIQPVWRADKPQIKQGRFREFYQCDVDTIGTYSMLADSEILTMVNEILTSLKIPNFRIRINNRKVLTGITKFIGLPESETATVCRSIDKLDKISLEEVKAEMLRNEIPQESISKLEPILKNAEISIEELEKILTGNETAEKGISELKEVFANLKTFNVPTENFTFDVTLARGLDYYTGTIFETNLLDYPNIGSLTGGGRYDQMISLFSGTESPAVGTTVGLDRIIAAMQQIGMFEESSTRTKVYVTLFSNESLKESLRITQMLRDANICTEMSFEQKKLAKQFKFADQKQIPFVIVIGEEEIENQTVTVKNLKEGSQETVKLEDLILTLKLKGL